MTYFRIRSSTYEKHIGKIPQVKDVIYNGSVEASDFVDRVYYTKVDFEPVVANPVLHPKAILTDLIAPFGMGSTFTILISLKLKLILEHYRDDGMQFFQCSVFHKGIEYKDYWMLNIYELNQEYIDFKNSLIIHEKHADDFETTYNIDKVEVKVDSQEGFKFYLEEVRKRDEVVIIKELKLLHNRIVQDFFALRYVEGGVGYYVSEELKKQIEDTDCTGIIFQSSELSYNEWTAPGGEREKVYGKSW